MDYFNKARLLYHCVHACSLSVYRCGFLIAKTLGATQRQQCATELLENPRPSANRTTPDNFKYIHIPFIVVIPIKGLKEVGKRRKKEREIKIYKTCQE